MACLGWPRPALAVGRAYGVLPKPGNPCGRKQEFVLFHAQRPAALHVRRDALGVQEQLVVDGSGQEPRGPLDLVLARMPEEEEVISIERDSVAPAQIPTPPDHTHPPTHPPPNVLP